MGAPGAWGKVAPAILSLVEEMKESGSPFFGERKQARVRGCLIKVSLAAARALGVETLLSTADCRGRWGEATNGTEGASSGTRKGTVYAEERQEEKGQKAAMVWKTVLKAVNHLIACVWYGLGSWTSGFKTSSSPQMLQSIGLPCFGSPMVTL